MTRTWLSWPGCSPAVIRSMSYAERQEAPKQTPLPTRSRKGHFRHSLKNKQSSQLAQLLKCVICYDFFRILNDHFCTELDVLLLKQPLQTA